MVTLESYFRMEELIQDLGIVGTGDRREDGTMYGEPGRDGPWSDEFLGNIHRLRALTRFKLH
jgi:hypothetical protein